MFPRCDACKDTTALPKQIIARAMDGAVAARFLQTVKEKLEKTATLNDRKQPM